MGGRGASSSAGGSTLSPEDLARDLAKDIKPLTEFDKVVLKEFRDQFSKVKTDDDRKYGVSEDGVWVINRDGSEVNISVSVDSTDLAKQIDLRKAVYFQFFNGDDVYDSLGMVMSKDFGYGDDSTEKLERYNDEINRIFKTDWGKRH